MTFEDTPSADNADAAIIDREPKDTMAAYANADWNLVPESLRSQLSDYIERGKTPGVFLTSVLAGDLFAAANLAPGDTLSSIGDIARFIARHAPRKCWSSPRDVHLWIWTGGAAGNGLPPAA